MIKYNRLLAKISENEAEVVAKARDAKVTITEELSKVIVGQEDVIEHIFVEVFFAPTNPEDPYKASFFEYLFNAQFEHLLSLKIWSILECD